MFEIFIECDITMDMSFLSRLLLSLFLVACIFIPSMTRAHVGYVLNQDEMHMQAGSDVSFLLQPLHRFPLIILMLVSLLMFVVLIFLERQFHFLQALDRRVEKRARTYGELFGWILRLSLGIALLGSGTSGVFLSPVLSASSSIAFLETLLGFFLLVGLFVGPAAFISVLLYFCTLGIDRYNLSHLDFLMIAVSICVLGDSRPGVDDLFSIPQLTFLKRWKSSVPTMLSMGVGASMVYLALYEKLLNPHMSALVVERFSLQSVIPVSVSMWVLSAGLIELLVGVLLILRVKPRLISAIAFLVLSVSFFYFKESVDSHITLFGSLSVIFCYGERKSLS